MILCDNSSKQVSTHSIYPHSQWEDFLLLRQFCHFHYVIGVLSCFVISIIWYMSYLLFLLGILSYIYSLIFLFFFSISRKSQPYKSCLILLHCLWLNSFVVSFMGYISLSSVLTMCSIYLCGPLIFFSNCQKVTIYNLRSTKPAHWNPTSTWIEETKSRPPCQSKQSRAGFNIT